MSQRKDPLARLRLEDETLRKNTFTKTAGNIVKKGESKPAKAGSKERSLGLGTTTKKEPAARRDEDSDALDELISKGKSKYTIEIDKVEAKGSEPPKGPRGVTRDLHASVAPKEAYSERESITPTKKKNAKDLKKFFGSGSKGDRDDMKVEDYESPPPSPKKGKE